MKLKTVVARDIMTLKVNVIDSEMAISEVAKLMLRERVSGYPIIDQQGVLVGVVTVTDLFKLIDQLRHDLKESIEQSIEEFKSKPISFIMSKNVIGISPDTLLEEIIEIACRWKIHTFPVIEDNKLVGIIGRHDILSATFSNI